MKILIRATNWIGDAILSLPALRAIRCRFPAAEITVLAKPWVSALYEGEGSIDRVLLLQGASGAGDWKAKFHLIRLLRRGNFDLAILFPNSFESAAVVRLAGVKRIIGYSRDARGFLLTEAIPAPKPGEIPVHERFYYLELLRRAGLIDTIPDTPEIRLDGVDELRAKGRQRFVSLPVVGVSPGAAYGSAKRWLPERFAESAARLASELGASVAVFGSASEKAMCEQVANAAGGHNFAGATSLREFIEMTAACRVFLTNDSGAMHIASALGVPSVTVFGPTDETATGPLGPSARLVREPVDRAPCLLR
jgi:heptosyltransferase-2